MAKRAQKPNFEEGLAQLEALVQALEEGKLPLDESFEAYERGVALLKDLEAKLSASEARVRLLTENGEEQPYAREGE